MSTQHALTFCKRPLAILATGLCAVMILSLFACAPHDPSQAESQSTNQGDEQRLTILASIFASYDFARTIAGEEAEVSLLVPPGVESHSFEPTASDILLLNSADIFIYVGGESDAWLEKIIASLDNPDLTLIRLTDLVETLEEEELEGPESGEVESVGSTHEHADGEEVHEEDEHVWTSLQNAQLIVQALSDTFSELDPAHAQDFSSNSETLMKELSTLNQRIADIVKNAERSTLVFGDRFPFRYFADDYDLTYYAAFPGCSTAVDTNPATIAFLIDKVHEDHIPVVFYIELSDQRIARTISEETGARMLCFHSAHNISKEDMEAGVTYLSLMQENADNLEAALN